MFPKQDLSEAVRKLMNAPEWSQLRSRLSAATAAATSEAAAAFFERLAEEAEVGIGASPETGALPGEREEDLRLRTRDFGTDLG